MQKQLTRLPYIICYLCAFVLGMKQLREPDVWWQLFSGRWMLENGVIAKTNLFSYTTPGSKWINVNWLYEIVIATLEKGFGPHGVILLQAIINVAIVYLLLRLCQLVTRQLGEAMSGFYSTLTVILFLVVSESRMAGRPEMVSHLLMAIFMLTLWKANEYNWEKIWWLIPLQCLWANMHEGFPLGIVIVGMYVAGGFISHLLNGNTKETLQPVARLAVVWVAMVAVTFINPFGAAVWNSELFTPAVANKFSPGLYAYSDSFYWTLQAKLHHTVFIVVCLFGAFRLWQHAKGTRKIHWTPALAGYLLLLPVLEYMSLVSNSNIPFAQMALFPAIPLLLHTAVRMVKLDKKDFYINAAKRTAIISAALAIIFYITVVSNKFYTATASPHRYGMHVSNLHNPTNAAEYIERYKLKGPVFTDHTTAPYLLWSLSPGFKPYIDSRGDDAYPVKITREYLKLYETTSGFKQMDSLYKFNYIVINNDELNPLRMLLYWGEGFNVAHVDPVCMIMIRNNKENEEINHSAAVSKLFDWPQESIDPAWAEALSKFFNPALTVYEEEDEIYAPVHAARFYNNVRNGRISLKMLQPAMRGDLSESPEALAVLGEAYVLSADFSQTKEDRQNKWDSGGIFYNKALDIDGKSYDAHMGLATLSLMKSDFKTAKKHLGFCVSTKPDDYFVYFLNGFAASNLWHVQGEDDYIDEIITSMKKSLELNRDEQKAHLYLADAYQAKGYEEKAKEQLKALTGVEMTMSASEMKILDNLKKQTGIDPGIRPQKFNPAGHDHDHEH